MLRRELPISKRLIGDIPDFRFIPTAGVQTSQTLAMEICCQNDTWEKECIEITTQL